MSDLSSLHAAVFTPHLNSAVTLVSEDGLEIATTLIACTENPRSTMRGAPRTAFNLILDCPAEEVPHFNGASFTVVHPVLGSIGPVYVERILPVTAGHGTDRAVFQIVFN